MRVVVVPTAYLTFHSKMVIPEGIDEIVITSINSLKNTREITDYKFQKQLKGSCRKSLILG